MGTIKSDRDLVQEYTSQLTNACQQLASTGEVTKDEQTELEGNRRNHEVIDQAMSFLKQITTAVATATEQLHSVANDFEAADQVGAQNFKGE